MKFYVEKAVLDSGVKIVFPVIKGVDNSKDSKEWQKLRQEKIEELLKKYENLDVHQDPILEGFNIIHDKVGVKRRKNIPASENLIKLLKKNKDLFYINKLVDIYNIISLESKLALGAHDIDHVDGNVTLRFTDGTEKYQPLGQSEAGLSAPHEYSYCDDSNEVLCRCEIRQVSKTAVNENTKNVFYIVQGNEATDDNYLIEVANKIIDITTKYCGGEGEVVIPKVI
ncbi:B3/B4 domain-containing protein [Lachnospira multipara]|uniref:B3/B4 domain-containing protein n=1 Tax=Lachnospira multipara TaxID=28051 RepID=UPI00041C4383|nr:phenylalanine--tRNA ligase beta subunit-related protein [Lachnospira multipara]